MTVVELRRKATEARDKALAIVQAAEKENRETTEDENELMADLGKVAEGFDRRAAALEKAEAAVAEGRQVSGRVTAPIGSGSAVETETVESVRGGSEAEKRQGFGDFLRCVAIMGDSRASHRQKEQAHETIENLYGSRYNAWDEKRALSQASGAAGGYTVPRSFVTQIMSVAGESAIVRSRAMVVPMDTDTIEIPMLDQTTAPTAGNTSFFGGVVAAWSAEAATISSTQPGFRQATLTAHELTGYTEVSRTLLQNSAVSLDALLTRLFGGAVAWYEDFAFLRGNGVGKPLGVLNSPALVSTAARGSASAISFANARKVWVKVPMSSRGRAVWLVSQGAEEAVLDMTGTSNSVFVPTGYYVTGTNDNAAGQPINYSLLGRPVLVSEKLPALNTAGDFGCYDFGHYLVGDRRSMEVATSEHFKFSTNQIAFRFVHRVGGMPWLNAPITLSDASTTVSPFVSLAIQ